MRVSAQRISAPWWLGYGVLAAVHLGCQVFAPETIGTRLTQVLLAPLLIVVLARSTTAPRSRTVRWTISALVFCFLGDLLPGVLPESVRFPAMIGAFLIAQSQFIVAFAPWRRHSILVRRRGLAVIYGAAFLVLVVTVGPKAGVLFIPVVVYGAMLPAMGLLSTGIGRLGALGGVLFFVSDALIAINTFALAVPAAGFVIMATYAAALALLVAAVVALPDRSPEPNAVPSSPV